MISEEEIILRTSMIISATRRSRIDLGSEMMTTGEELYHSRTARPKADLRRWAKTKKGK